jgi:N-acetyl-gamma-glutamyl-phosphate reductase
MRSCCRLIFPITINAVSGYSGGGRSMIEAHESGEAPEFELYGLGLEHKHVPEIQHYARLQRRPIFVPSVGNFRQGMLVSIPLHLGELPGKPSARDLEAALRPPLHWCQACERSCRPAMHPPRAAVSTRWP